MGLAEEAMYRSIVNGDVQTVERLLTHHHVDPDLRYYSHSTPALNFAIMREQHEIAYVLLLHGASVNQTDCDQKKSALHCAVSTRNLVTVNMLLQERANPNLKDLDGSTPVHLAARLGDLDIFTALLDAGGNAEARDGNCRTPLLVACAHGNIQIITYLLSNNLVDVTVHDFDYNTVLHLYRRCPLTLFKKFISMGARVSALNSFGQSPLYLYVNWLSSEDFGDCDTDCYRCLYWLLLNGADPNQRCFYYLRSPLAVAVCNEDLIAISLMLSFGADPHLPDSLGRTPASLAIRSKNTQILREFYYNGMNARWWTEHVAAKCVVDRFFSCSASGALNQTVTGQTRHVRSLQFISALAVRRSLGRRADRVLFNSNLPFNIKSKVVSFGYYALFANAC